MTKGQITVLAEVHLCQCHLHLESWSNMFCLDNPKQAIGGFNMSITIIQAETGGDLMENLTTSSSPRVKLFGHETVETYCKRV